MRSVCLFIFCQLPLLLFGQYRVELRVQSLPAYHNHSEPVFVAGSFNNWNPGDEKFKLQKNGPGYSITLDLAQGNIEFKFTRGSWEKVESTAEGSGISNRSLTVTENVVVDLAIAGWQDHFPPKPKRSTAGPNVRVIDTAFYIPQLDRRRRVWIYLPEWYAGTDERFSVLYMHDGQNVFDESTSFSGEWGVDEMMDSSGIWRFIVVAVDHGGDKRLNEYNPYDNERFGEGEGEEYADFLVNTLKPYIDRHYRTKGDRKHTFLAGSSMGGLISMYAILKYPKVFGGAGVLSPAFWVSPGIYDYMRSRSKKIKGNVFLYAGKHEDETMVPNAMKALEILSKRKKAKVKLSIRDDGKHNEAAWRKELPNLFTWLMYGSPMGIEKQIETSH